MIITIVKEGSSLRVVEQEAQLPDSKPIRFFSEDELPRLIAEQRAILDAQMPAFLRGDEDESAEDLF